MGRLRILPAALLALWAPAAAAASASQIGIWTPALYALPPAPPGRPPSAALPPADRRGPLPPEAQCIAAILDAERAAGITDHLLLAMGFTEAGRRTERGLFTVWPWTVNSEGRSRYFTGRADAIAFVRDEQRRGVRSIDVGCLQINLKWHPDAFPDLDTAFDPVANARYAASFLGALQRDHGSLDTAIARYHSARSELGTAYRERVTGNRRWVAGALGYLETLAAGPRTAAPVWTKAELGQLAFLSGLVADGPARPLLPDARP
ncbi:transglycosylase [Azospirillum halopraeferens]|uniref:transglycosylase n=1 Tax=Azospirillum halopraeferens TaxID=34010 RepID=UPI0003FA2826|nr:transglycosylase [Azospirillum halopraeferens]